MTIQSIKTAMMAIAFLFSLRLPKQAAYLHHDD